MKIFPFFSVQICWQYSKRVLLLLTLAAGLQTTLSAANNLTCVQSDTLPPKLPCYHQFNKEIIRSGLYISAHASNIPEGVVDFFSAFAKSNRNFRRCLDQHYPLGKK